MDGMNNKKTPVLNPVQTPSVDFTSVTVQDKTLQDEACYATSYQPEA